VLIQPLNTNILTSLLFYDLDMYVGLILSNYVDVRQGLNFIKTHNYVVQDIDCLFLNPAKVALSYKKSKVIKEVRSIFYTTHKPQ